MAFIWFPKKFIYKLSKVNFEFDIFIETKNFAQKRKKNIGIDCWVPILMIRNGKYERKNDREGFKNWFMINSANTSNNINNPRNINHPSVKDTKICEYIIEKTTKENNIILDPFNGSGTTCVAAKQLKRNFIGIEISEKYCKIAQDRLRQQILL